jgi:CelD/BcsL family acetyltransferase involved in cellulose biosynthesis
MQETSLGLTFERVAFADVDWAALDAMPDRVFSQRREWIEYGVEITGGEPVIAALHRAGQMVGWFSAIKIRKVGVSILGSPFPQWNYPYLGFNLSPEVSRAEAFAALPTFAFKTLKCAHVEVLDLLASATDAGRCYQPPSPFKTFVSDLSMTEEALLKRMKPMVRRAIRKAEREGVRIEEAAPEGFAAEHYSQLLEVFARQGRKPPYGSRRIEALIRRLHPVGGALLLRAVGPDGRSIATGIYVGDDRMRKFWSNGSRRETLPLRPNQLLHWEAMRRCKALGVSRFDWGGGGAYKEAYGAEPKIVWRLQRSAHPLIGFARNAAYDAILGLRTARETMAARFRASVSADAST